MTSSRRTSSREKIPLPTDFNLKGGALGRILGAIGNAWSNDAGLSDLDTSRIRLWLGNRSQQVLVAENGGAAASYREADAAAIMRESEISIRVDLARGKHSANVWSCDLSYDYVKINADYRS